MDEQPNPTTPETTSQPQPVEPTADTFVIRRSPVGIIMVYIETVAAVLVLAVFAIIVFPNMFKNMSSSDKSLLALGGLVIIRGLSTYRIILAAATYLHAPQW